MVKSCTRPGAPGRTGRAAAHGREAGQGQPVALGTQLVLDASPHTFGLFVTDALYEKLRRLRRRAVRAVRAAAAELRARREKVAASASSARARSSRTTSRARSPTWPGCFAGPLGAGSSWARRRRPDQPGQVHRLGRWTACGLQPGDFGPFNTKAAAYEDNVVSWPSVEPADDYTANSLLASPSAGGSRPWLIRCCPGRSRAGSGPPSGHRRGKQQDRRGPGGQ